MSLRRKGFCAQPEEIAKAACTEETVWRQTESGCLFQGASVCTYFYLLRVMGAMESITAATEEEVGATLDGHPLTAERSHFDFAINPSKCLWWLEDLEKGLTGKVESDKTRSAGQNQTQVLKLPMHSVKIGKGNMWKTSKKGLNPNGNHNFWPIKYWRCNEELSTGQCLSWSCDLGFYSIGCIYQGLLLVPGLI